MMSSNELDGFNGNTSPTIPDQEKVPQTVPPAETIQSNAPFDFETRERLIDVRTQVLRGGLYGMFAGTAIGTLLHLGVDRFIMRSGVARMVSLRFPALHIPHRIPKNSFLPTILAFGALGNFSSSSVSGRNSLNTVTDIWTVNSNSKSSYQNQMRQNKAGLNNDQEESFLRRTAQIKESKARKEELAKWAPPKV